MAGFKLFIQLMVRLLFCRFMVLVWAVGVALAGLLSLSPGQVRGEASTATAGFLVTNTNDSGPGSLREAIAAANSSPGPDLINIPASGTVVLLSPLPVITDSVTIEGPGAGKFILDGNNNFRVMEIAAADVSLAELTIQNGNASSAPANGAGILSTGNLTLSNVEVISNTTQSHGGGLYVNGDLTITGGLIQNNRSTNGIGGGLRSEGITTITGAQFINNTSQGDGGGAFILGSLALIEVLFQDNRCLAVSCDGGGLFSFSQTNIDGTVFFRNTAQDDGGGASSPGVLTISGGVFQENQARFGSGGGLTIQNLAVIEDTQFLSNTARSLGGGISTFGTADLTGVLFQNNQSTSGNGGGLYTSGSTTIDRARFIRNTARQGGGYHHARGDSSIVNSLFAENNATDTAGMDLLLASAERVEVFHVTVAGPASMSGTAIVALAGAVEISNTILTGHAVGINNTGASVEQDFNLFFGNGLDLQGVISGGGNSLTGDPLFADPAADDYHLSLGSPAVNAGTDVGITTDFDGEARPSGGGFDLGFDELQSPPDTPPPPVSSYPVYLPLLGK